MRSIDTRPYPRTEMCEICEERAVDVISPADFPVCERCHLEMAEEMSGPMYGFPMTTNPHEFEPDTECCTPEEIARWEADKARYDAAEPVGNPREGSGWYLNDKGERVAHMVTTAWGVGVTTITKNTVSPDFGPHTGFVR